MPSVGSYEGAFSCERGTPVHGSQQKMNGGRLCVRNKALESRPTTWFRFAFSIGPEKSCLKDSQESSSVLVSAADLLSALSTRAAEPEAGPPTCLSR